MAGAGQPVLRADGLALQFDGATQPLALLACLVPVLGWGALGGRGATFALLLLGGYALMIALFSRPDNFYWGFLLLPHWFAGYALAPRGIGQLWSAARGMRA